MLCNRPRTVQYMREAGLDAIIAAAPMTITYFSGYSWPLETAMRQFMFSPEAPGEFMFSGFVVFPVEGEPTLIVGTRFALNTDDVEIDDVRWFGTNFAFDMSLTPQALGPPAGDVVRGKPYPSAASGVAAVLKERGIAAGRIGVEMDGMGTARHEALRNELSGAELLDCTKLIRLVRMVKTDDEVDRLRTALEITERAAAEAVAQAREGCTLGSIETTYRVKLAEHNANFAALQMAARGVGLTTQGTYVPAPDEVIFSDWCAVYRSYWADIGMSFTFGDLPAAVKEKDAALKACVTAGGRALRPGVTASEVFKAMCDTLAAGGIKDNDPQGHGIGLDVREYPIIGPDSGGRIADDCVDVPVDLPIEEKMVINLEIGHFLPGRGSIQNELSYLVHADGAELLLSYRRQPPVLT